MSLDRVNSVVQKTPKLLPKLNWEQRDVFVLVRFTSGDEQWYGVKDLAMVRAQYEVIGFARRT